MPVIRVHGADLHYEDTGGTGEPVLFLHGFLFDGRQYEAQVAALRDQYRCLTLDFRGQGRSAASRGGYQTEQLTADVLAAGRWASQATWPGCPWAGSPRCGSRPASPRPSAR